jgi:outer membrane protein
MKKSFGTLLLIALSVLAFGQNTYKMSLQEAIDYAVKNQPTFQNYTIDQSIASSRKLESIAKYIPKVNASADLRNNLIIPTIVLDRDGQIITFKQGQRYTATAGFDLNVPLVDVSTIGDIKYTQQSQVLTGLAKEKALVDLKLNVSKAYYAVLVGEERVKKAESAVNRNSKAYSDAKVKFDNQLAIKTDVNRAYLNAQNATYQLNVARDYVTNAKAQLSQVIGLTPGSVIDPTDVLPAQLQGDTAINLPEYSTVADNRVELRSEQANLRLSQLQKSKINFQYIPTLNGYGYYGGQGFDENNLFQRSSWYQVSYIGLKLAVPIFDGLQKVALSQQQKLQMQKSEKNIEAIKLQVNYELQNSATNMANAARNLRLQKENITLAEDIVKDAQVRYTNALATLQETIDAENTLRETEFNYMQALYDYLVAELEWKKANGKL